MATLSIDRRFCGPPGSGNGGYTAGRLAALIGDPAEITLRRPPPLETEMRVERAGPRLLLMHGEDLIAEAQKTVVELAIPECPSLHEARRASTGYPGLDRHPFPGCFVCGPQRAADGMAVFPGPLTDGRAWAAVWSAASGHEKILVCGQLAPAAWPSDFQSCGHPRSGWAASSLAWLRRVVMRVVPPVWMGLRWFALPISFRRDL